MTSRASRLFLVPCALFSLAACSSSAPPTDGLAASDDDSLSAARRRATDAGAPDGGHDAAVDAAPPSGGYPAFLPDAPRLVSRGGPVLASPRLQVITFAGDPLASDIEAFASRLGRSQYWSVATSEYGVGAMRALPPIRLAEAPPASIEDAAFRAWLDAKLAAPSGFGPPDASTIYAVFFPQGTTVTIGSVLTGCVSSGGYHWDATMRDGTDVPYVVMPRCASLGNLVGLDALTSVASHELAEAATDPRSQSDPAYFAIDDAHYVFADYYEPEIGDLCVEDKYITAKPADVGYTVQRLWSNASAAAGHHPCVPAPPLYFNAEPALPDSVTANGVATRGVSVALGRSRTIDLRLFSDAPSAPWSITAYDVATVRGGAEELRFALDRSTGANGDVVRLTITRTARAARGFSEAMIWSQLAGESNFWPVIVGD